MFNLLNEISSTMVGIISLVVLLIVLAVFIILNIKFGTQRALINLGVITASILLAVFLAKPILSLFDKIFGFSMVFFNIYMGSFGQIDSMNTIVTTSNYTTSVENFKNASIGMSDTLKRFLEKIFDETYVSNENPTTLSAVASTSMSYLTALFIVALIIFVVSFVLIKLLIKLISKRFKKSKDDMPRFAGGLIGIFKGLVFGLILLVTFATFPFFGISADYIGNGFESTVVFNSVYQLVAGHTQDIMIQGIDFPSVNVSSYQSREDVKLGYYKNNTEDNPIYEIQVYVQESYLTITEKNTQTNNIKVETFNKVIFTNNSFYIFKDGKLTKTISYNLKNSSMSYKVTEGNKTETYRLKFQETI